MRGKIIGIIFLCLGPELVLPVYSLSWPRFITPWVFMDSNNASSTDQTFDHGFGTVPMKVEVQVKSPDTGFIYPGVGSSHGTNAQGHRGGVLCIFNTDQVRLLGATNDNSIQNTAYIIYTGNLSWTQGHQDRSTTGWVRARVWHPDDFPEPNYTDRISLKSGGDFVYLLDLFIDVWTNKHTHLNVRRIQHHSNSPLAVGQADSKITLTKNPTKCVRENSGSLTHNLGTIPAYTVVLYHHPVIPFATESLTYWYAEAQGSNAHKQNDDSIFWGALTYAVGPTDIRFWAPSSDNFGLLSFCEGWGSYLTDTCSFTRCDADVYMWSEFPGATRVHVTGSADATTDTTKEFSITPGFNADSDLISVMFEAIDGENQGYQFAASGAAQLDGIDECGGVVYGYLDTGRTVRLWHPTTTVYNGYIVFIYEMGDDWKNQRSTDVILHINVWKVNASVTTTPAPTTSSTVTTSTSTSTMSSTSTTSTTSTTTTPTPSTTTSTPSTSVTTTSTITTTLISPADTSTTPSSSPPLTSTTQPPPIGTTIPPYTSNITIVQPSDPSTAAPGILCFNTTVEVNITVIHKRAEEIIANLTVDTKTTSKFRRTLVSATDNRQSSMYIGMIGALFSGIVIALIVIPDLLALFRLILSDRIIYSDF